jgi:hypothetical protein
MEFAKIAWPLAASLVVVGFLLTSIGVVSSQSPYLTTTLFWESVEINAGLVLDLTGLLAIRWIRNHPYSFRPMSAQF